MLYHQKTDTNKLAKHNSISKSHFRIERDISRSITHLDRLHLFNKWPIHSVQWALNLSSIHLSSFEYARHREIPRSALDLCETTVS